MLSNIDLKSEEVCSSVIVLNYTGVYNITSLIDKRNYKLLLILLISSYKYSLYWILNNKLSMNFEYVLVLIK